jgi:hypothetical protein
MPKQAQELERVNIHGPNSETSGWYASVQDAQVVCDKRNLALVARSAS